MVTQIIEMASQLDLLASSLSLLSHSLACHQNCFSKPQLSIYVFFLGNLRWWLLNYRIKFKSLCLVFKAICNLRSTYCFNLISCMHSASPTSTVYALTLTNKPYISSHVHTNFHVSRNVLMLFALSEV